MTSPHCPVGAAACKFFSACYGVKSFLLPLFQRSTFSKHQISLLQGYPRLLQNFPSSRVSRARASNLPFALVSKARASNFSLSRVSRSRASHFPYCKGIRGRASSFPFSRASKGRGCSFLFSKVKGELLQGVLELLPGQKEVQENPILWCHFGTQPFGCNPWADAEGEARNLAHKIFIGEAPGALWIQIPAVFHQMLKRMKFVDLVEKQPLFLLPPMIEEGVGVQEPFGKGESLCPFFNG